MQIQKNSRQIPKVKSITSHKEYSDLMYGYLQSISFREEETNRRFVNAKDVSFTKLGNELKISRQTAAKRFKNLINLGLIVEYPKEKVYELPTLIRTDAFLIPKSTLEQLVYSLHDNSVSVYIYLVNRFFANKEQPFIFTLSTLKGYCGLSTNTKSNNQIITYILKTLEKLKLIKYSCQTTNVSNEIKTQYTLESVELIV